VTHRQVNCLIKGTCLISFRVRYQIVSERLCLWMNYCVIWWLILILTQLQLSKNTHF